MMSSRRVAPHLVRARGRSPSFRSELHLLGAFLVLILSASSLSARELRSFDDGLAELREGRPESARAVFVDLLDHLATGVGPPDESRKNFGSLLLYRAVAEHALGRTPEARWSWHEALAIRPELATEDLSSLGEQGAFLVANPPREVEPGVTFDGLSKEPEADGSPDCFEKSHRPAPSYPSSLRTGRFQANVKVLLLVLEDGSLDSPHLATRGNLPAFEYAALESLRDARCKPLEKGRDPGPTWYPFQVHYRLR